MEFADFMDFTKLVDFKKLADFTELTELTAEVQTHKKKFELVEKFSAPWPTPVYILSPWYGIFPLAILD